jgi:hypothetical protein
LAKWVNIIPEFVHGRSIRLGKMKAVQPVSLPFCRCVEPPARPRHQASLKSEITMFNRTIADTEPAPVVPSEQLVPLVELELSLDAPAQGWAAHLAARDIEIVTDDIGRPSITRSEARQLIAERAAAEERRAELLRRADEQAEEFDRAWRRSIGAGIPADLIPAGMTYAEAALSAELDGVGYRPRASVVADAFGAPDSLVFHPLTGEVDEL